MKRLAFALLLLMAACGNKTVSVPDDVLPKEKMMQVLMEMHVADAVVDSKVETGGNEAPLTQAYYAQVLKNHSLTQEDFQRSFQFYEAHPELLDKIYDDMLQQLSKKEAAISKQ